MAQIRNLKTGIKYKDTPIGKIPVDWELVKIRDITAQFYDGGTPDTSNKNYWGGNIPWITGADIENQKVSKIGRYITQEGVKMSTTNIVPQGNLLVVIRTSVGKLAIAPFDIAISQDITGLMLNPERAFAGYVYWYLIHNERRLKSLIQGRSMNGILREHLELFQIPLPTIKDQKKIAEILSTVDEAIEKAAKIIEKTKEINKGLMQVLLKGNLRVMWE